MGERGAVVPSPRSRAPPAVAAGASAFLAGRVTVAARDTDARLCRASLELVCSRRGEGTRHRGAWPSRRLAGVGDGPRAWPSRFGRSRPDVADTDRGGQLRLARPPLSGDAAERRGDYPAASARNAQRRAAAPPPSDIPNVFGMNEPQHMLTKLYVEIWDLSASLSVWTKSE